MKRQILFLVVMIIVSNINAVDIWKRSDRQLIFSESFEQADIRLRTFYGKWLDKVYKIDLQTKGIHPLINQNEMFLSYWKQDDKNKNFYYPCNNVHKIAIDNETIDKEITAYYQHDETFSNVTKIRYWLVDMAPNDDKATFVQPETSIECFVKKYIQINNFVYTCVTGRGTRIRNIETINLQLNNQELRVIDNNNTNFIVLSKPYMLKAIGVD